MPEKRASFCPTVQASIDGQGILHIAAFKFCNTLYEKERISRYKWKANKERGIIFRFRPLFSVLSLSPLETTLAAKESPARFLPKIRGMSHGKFSLTEKDKKKEKKTEISGTDFYCLTSLLGTQARS